MKLTVFSNFLNEEFLLEPWLLHHRKIFDHGILLDYGSTDSSVSIIKKICPSWQIVYPTVRFGKAYEDIQRLEVLHSGWKMTLNTTEFVMNMNLKQLVRVHQHRFPSLRGIRACGVNIVDIPGSEDAYDPSIPLILQKHWGYFDHDLVALDESKENRLKYGDLIMDTRKWILMGVDGRSRLIHNQDHGHYISGRHCTKLDKIYPRSKDVCPESKIIVAWYGYAPYSRIKDRIGRRWIKYNIDTLLPYQQKLARNLLEDNAFKTVFEEATKIYKVI